MDLRVDSHVLEEHTASIFSTEDGGSKFLQNTGIYLQAHMLLLSRRPTSTSTLLWEPQISYLEIQSKKYWLFFLNQFLKNRSLVGATCMQYFSDFFLSWYFVSVQFKQWSLYSTLNATITWKHNLLCISSHNLHVPLSKMWCCVQAPLNSFSGISVLFMDVSLCGVWETAIFMAMLSKKMHEIY
jgi:hypothetical protein